MSVEGGSKTGKKKQTKRGPLDQSKGIILTKEKATNNVVRELGEGSGTGVEVKNVAVKGERREGVSDSSRRVRGKVKTRQTH